MAEVQRILIIHRPFLRIYNIVIKFWRDAHISIDHDIPLQPLTKAQKASSYHESNQI
jgi:hypothetical protein